MKTWDYILQLQDLPSAAELASYGREELKSSERSLNDQINSGKQEIKWTNERLTKNHDVQNLHLQQVLEASLQAWQAEQMALKVALGKIGLAFARLEAAAQGRPAQC